MSDIDFDRAVQERIAEAARAGEQRLMDELRARGADHLWAKVKAGLKAQAFLERGVGKAFAEGLSVQIAEACDVWLTSDDPAKVAEAKNQARGALTALAMFDSLIAESEEARREISVLENEFGSD